MAASQVVGVEEVLGVLKRSMAGDPVGRDASLRVLEHWQKESVPGVLSSLLEIVGAKDKCEIDLRIYAAIMSKNVVGCTWNRSASSTFGRTFVEKREWALISDAEKESMKGGLLPLLFNEPEERVVTQLLVLIAGVARYDFPAKWPNLLSELLHIATDPQQTFSFREKGLAFRALNRVLFALKEKKALVSVTSAELLRDRAKLQEFAKQGSMEMKTLLSSVASAFPMLCESWEKWSGVLGRGEEHWEDAGFLANKSLSCIRHAILVLASFEAVPCMTEFFGKAAQQAAILRDFFISPPPGSPACANVSAWREVASESFRKINKCCIAAIDKHPREFAPMMTSFMQLYVESIMSLTYDSFKAMKQKRMVLMTRFLAKIFHCPTYKRHPSLLLNRLSAEKGSSLSEGMQKAHRYIGEFFEGPMFPKLVESLITKFLVFTDEELEEWDSDPENFFLVSNLDLDIESEVRRCCAEALLLFMMERNVESASRVVLTMASNAASQAAQNQDPQLLRLAEACFHAIDVTAQLIPPGTLSYDSFFVTDLAKYLDMQTSDILVRTMQGRVLHLLVTFSSELSPQSYERALRASLKFLQSPDIVLALYSVKLLHKLCLAEIIGVSAKAEVHSRLLKAEASSMLRSSFQLASQLHDAETLQMVLKLIAVEVEALTDQTNVEIIQYLAVYVPQMWQTMLSLSEKESGFGASCQSSLINILLLLIEKVGDACLAVPQLKEVIFQLMGFCVNVGASHATYLLEDGLKLWRTVILYGSWQSIGDAMLSSKENLFRIIQSGKENHEALSILKPYVLLLGSQVVAEQEQLMKLVIEHCLSDNGTLKEAFVALDLLCTVALLDPDLAYRLSQQAIAHLLQKLKKNELTRTLLDPLLSLLAVFVLWNGNLLNVLAVGIVDELSQLLLSFKNMRSVHEFLALPGARAAGFMKRKVAVILLGFIARYYPEIGKKRKDFILQFGVSQVREEEDLGLSIENVLDVRAGLTQESSAEVWATSEFFRKAKEVYALDPVFTLKTRELVGQTAEYILAASNSDQQNVDNLLTNIMTNMSLAKE